MHPNFHLNYSILLLVSKSKNVIMIYTLQK
jgi:hypothetical protein